MDVSIVVKIAPLESTPTEQKTRNTDENRQLVCDYPASHWSSRFNDDASQEGRSRIALTFRWHAEWASRNHGPGL